MGSLSGMFVLKFILKRGEKMKKYFDKLQPYLEKGMAFQSALTLFQWDLETQAPGLEKKIQAKL